MLGKDRLDTASREEALHPIRARAVVVRFAEQRQENGRPGADHLKRYVRAPAEIFVRLGVAHGGVEARCGDAHDPAGRRAQFAKAGARTGRLDQSGEALAFACGG